MRYLFCSFATFGLIRPAIGVAQALVRRGHTVAFATDQSMAGLLSQAGLARIARGPEDGPSFRVELNGHPLEIARQVRHIDYAIAQFQPDVLVGQELALGPVIAAERHGLPLASIGLATYIWPSPADPPALYQDALRRHDGFVSGYNVAREIFGMPAREIDPLATSLIGDLLLLRSVPELEGRLDTLPQRIEFVGDLDWQLSPMDNGVAAWIADARAAGEPIIYAQPGRSFETPGFWDELVEAYAGQPIRIAASVGRMDHAPAAIPANFFVRGHVPQELVLPHAQAVISSSTTTAVLGALGHGLPLLLIPGGGGGEQAALTERCLRAGVALHIDPAELTAERLRATLDTLLAAPAIGAQARHMRQLFQHAGGSPRAAALLEDFAALSRPHPITHRTPSVAIPA